MERQVALILSIIFFVVFALLTYFGAQVTVWSSIIFALFVGLILLNIFYPPSQATSEDANASLVIYAVIEIGGLLLLAVYIAHKTLIDTRT